MNKRRAGKTLSRVKEQRIALKRTMLVSMVEHGRITTTLAKAKEVRPYAERMITKAKKSSGKGARMVVMRNLMKEVPAKTAKKLIDLADMFKERNGGYVRIIKLPFRKRDCADMALIEWTQQLEPAIVPEKKDDGKKKSKKEKKEKKSQ